MTKEMALDHYTSFLQDQEALAQWLPDLEPNVHKDHINMALIGTGRLTKEEEMDLSDAWVYAEEGGRTSGFIAGMMYSASLLHSMLTVYGGES